VTAGWLAALTAWRHLVDAVNTYCKPMQKMSYIDVMCAANGGVEMKQKRRTMNQEWSTFFDSHLYDGRVIHMTVVDQSTKAKLADIKIGVHILAKYCQQNGDQPVEVAVRLSVLNWGVPYRNFHYLTRTG